MIHWTTLTAGRAAIQICRHRGIPAVALLRPRDVPEAFEADVRELLELGAALVFADDGKAHRSPEAKEALRDLPPLALALNGVGGGDAHSNTTFFFVFSLSNAALLIKILKKNVLFQTSHPLSEL